MATVASYIGEKVGRALARFGFIVLPTEDAQLSTAPSISSGAGAASASEPNGSLRLRTDGDPEFRKGAAWVPPLLADGSVALSSLDLNGSLDQDVALVAAGDGHNLALTINHATAAVEGSDISVAQLTTSRTSGEVIAQKLATTSLAGDSGGTYIELDLSRTDGGGSASHTALRINAHDVGLDIAADNTPIRLGAGGDISIAWDGAKLAVTQAAPDSAVWWGVDGAGLDHVFYGDTASANVTWDQSADALTFNGAAVLLQTQAGSSGVKVAVQGPDLTHGIVQAVYEQTVSPAAIETTLITLPANSCVDWVQANVESALTGGGSTATVSIGITGNVDLFGTVFSSGSQADALTQNAKIDVVGTGATSGAGVGLWNPDTVDVKLIGAATGGASAGDTALTVGSVKVRIGYRYMLSIADA